MNYFWLWDSDLDYNSELNDRWTEKIKIIQLEREITEIESEIELIKNENLVLIQKNEIYNIKILEYNFKELKKLYIKIEKVNLELDQIDINSINETNTEKECDEVSNNVKNTLLKDFSDTELVKTDLWVKNPTEPQKKAYFDTMKNFVW